MRLRLPTIGVDSAIEDALITPEGRMDVPSGSVDVAWFALGPHPGEKGSAVIGGHYGIDNGIPYVFYNLNKVVAGDKVYIENDRGDTLAFIVRSIKTFDRDADATTVFTSEDGLAHLNIITCDGIWNQTNGTYPQRLVLFTDAMQAGGPELHASEDKTDMLSSSTTHTATSTAISSMNNFPHDAQRLVLLITKSLFTTFADRFITSFLFVAIIILIIAVIQDAILRKRSEGIPEVVILGSH